MFGRRRCKSGLSSHDGVLENLYELSAGEERDALEATTNLLKQAPKRRCNGRDFVEQGMGPSNRVDLGDAELASYNGKGGGEFW